MCCDGEKQMEEIAIKVDRVSKIYRLYDKPADRVRDALGFGKKKRYKEHFALNDVSFEIKRGESIGIIGTNGSGKSNNPKDHYRRFESHRRRGDCRWENFRCF